MARKKKVILSPEEELKQIIADIDQAKETLKSLERTKKALEEKIKMIAWLLWMKLFKRAGKAMMRLRLY